jgi:hypothetical protein
MSRCARPPRPRRPGRRSRDPSGMADCRRARRRPAPCRTARRTATLPHCMAASCARRHTRMGLRARARSTAHSAPRGTRTGRRGCKGEPSPLARLHGRTSRRTSSPSSRTARARSCGRSGTRRRRRRSTWRRAQRGSAPRRGAGMRRSPPPYRTCRRRCAVAGTRRPPGPAPCRRSTCSGPGTRPPRTDCGSGGSARRGGPR